MADRAIAAISGARTIDFAWFRRTFMANHELKDSLAFGHAVLDTVPKLDQYLWTYGPMIESQWEQVANVLATIDPPHQLVDYGCGQGLAGLLINDVTDGRLFADVAEVVLIEPSAIALARAEAIYAKTCPGAAVTSLCKRFDDISAADIPAEGGGTTLHVFSNSLDVQGFEPSTLFEKTLQPGRNVIISVSHDRSFNGGTPQIRATKQALEQFHGSRIARSTLDPFTCTSNNNPLGVVWLCELEIADG